MTERTEQLSSDDIMKTAEIHPHDLTKLHLPLIVKRPFLGLVPSGGKARIKFQAKMMPKGMRVLLVKTRGYNLASVSHRLIQFSPESAEDYIEVTQFDAASEPSLTVHVDYYSTGLDFCQNKLGHNPTCQHFMGSVTLHYSLAYAKLIAAVAAICAPVRRLAPLGIRIRDRLRELGCQVNIGLIKLGRRTRQLPVHARARVHERFSSLREKTAARVSAVPQAAACRTRIMSAEGRNLFRGMRRNPLVGALAALTVMILILIALAHGQFSLPSQASTATMNAPAAEAAQKHATRYLLRCENLHRISDNTMTEDCEIKGLDGEPPDQVICEGDYQIVRHEHGLELIGCRGVWQDSVNNNQS